ncbi:uncharacterized protein CIMG_08140 [Coccidioides immitis RS]|uniref:HAUS augmin-like complex subunit 6 N-terminal domain-containing protein n=1 Tax=Coccidioides immitis (strain RS) TaxID=246410 RepID=J3K4W9_COCIM|nr:uncharacterized protein CIMG_08140 [Coccidioides immitis RS]EAS29394.3 hypothetical protein CIMG_08140 [Coccidioides immitis RS]
MQRSSARSPTKQRVETWPGPAPLTIFLRNLKLLRLDTRSGWPNITLETLSGSQNNLRRRIQAVEWSLYHLFLIWDKNETHTKLQPFFPPLEPLQSVNLRAALFRMLSDLKKNGVLGREAILRKTMLDDCKSERFEEILASFSTAVLRKSLLPSQARSIAIDLATAQQLTACDQSNILPLILAYRSSLSSTINERKSLGCFYANLNQHLHAKADELSKRSPSGARSLLAADKVEHTRRNIISAWYGSGDWAKAILDGGLQVDLDPLLELDFSRLRLVAKTDGLDSVRSRRSSDLLADLDKRIAQQKSKLQKWREFRRTLTEDEPDATRTEAHSQNRVLAFRDHQKLTVASLAQIGQVAQNPNAQNPDYKTLLADFHESLAKFKLGAKLPDRRWKVESPIHQDREEERVHDGEEERAMAYKSDQAPSLQLPTRLREMEPSVGSKSVGLSRDVSMQNASPPMEMSPAQIAEAAASQSYQSQEPNPHDHTHDISERANHIGFTLVERTRLSMSRLSVPEARPRQSLGKSRVSRHSQSFPINQFETPDNKQRQKQGQRSGATTPRDELFSEDADYASVFKSRPKIATSPVGSPVVHVPVYADDNAAEISDMEVCQGDSYSHLDAENSPSLRRTMYM